MRARLVVRILALVFMVGSFGFTAPLAQAPAQPPSPLPAASLECPDLATALRAVANNDARLRDWPQIGRYREANRTVTGSEVGAGNSIAKNAPFSGTLLTTNDANNFAAAKPISAGFPPDRPELWPIAGTGFYYWQKLTQALLSEDVGGVSIRGSGNRRIFITPGRYVIAPMAAAAACGP